MSVKLMGAIWDLALPHEQAWVLMAYADHADHDGRNCFPGAALVAYKTGYSVRTVQRITAELLKIGVLKVQRAGGGRGKATVYQLDLTVAQQKPARPAAEDAAAGAESVTTGDCTPPVVATPEPIKGDILSPFISADSPAERVTSPTERVSAPAERVTESAERVTSPCRKGDTAMSPQPSLTELTVNEPSKEPSSSSARARVRARAADAAGVSSDDDDDGTEPLTLPMALQLYDAHMQQGLTVRQARELRGYLTRLKAAGRPEWFRLALQATADRGGRSWAYVRTALDNALRDQRAPGTLPDAALRPEHDLANATSVRRYGRPKSDGPPLAALNDSEERKRYYIPAAYSDLVEH